MNWLPNYLLSFNKFTNDLASNIKDNYFEYKKKVEDVRRLFWTTFDIHSKKPTLSRYWHTTIDTIKTVREYCDYSSITLIHQSPEYNLYTYEYKLHSEHFIHVIRVNKNTIKTIFAAYALIPPSNQGEKNDILGKEEWVRGTDITTRLKQFAGPDINFQADLSPKILGYFGVEVDVLTEDFEKIVYRFGPEEKFSDFF